MTAEEAASQGSAGRDDLVIVTTARLAAPIGQVWKLVGDFAGVMAWHPLIERCQADGSQVGALRTVTIDGRDIVERLDELDPDQFVMQYRVVEGGPAAIGLIGRIQLERVSDDETSIVWVTTVPDKPGAADLAAELRGYYPTRVEHLRDAVSR